MLTCSNVIVGVLNRLLKMSSCLKLSVNRPLLAQTRATAARPKHHAFTQQQRPPMRTKCWQLMPVAAKAAVAEAAAEVEEDIEEFEEDIGELEGVEEDTEELEKVTEKAGAPQWMSELLDHLQIDRSGAGERMRYTLSVLWLDKNIGIAVDQIFAKDQRSPMSEYFFWPRNDAWEEIKVFLEAKSWIGERERVLLLNQCTEVINFWQDGEKKSLAQARKAFPDVKFQGQ